MYHAPPRHFYIKAPPPPPPGYSTNQMQNQSSPALDPSYVYLLQVVIGSLALFVFIAIGHCDCFGLGFAMHS